MSLTLEFKIVTVQIPLQCQLPSVCPFYRSHRWINNFPFAYPVLYSLLPLLLYASSAYGDVRATLVQQLNPTGLFKVNRQEFLTHLQKRSSGCRWTDELRVVASSIRTQSSIRNPPAPRHAALEFREISTVSNYYNMDFFPQSIWGGEKWPEDSWTPAVVLNFAQFGHSFLLPGKLRGKRDAA